MEKRWRAGVIPARILILMLHIALAVIAYLQMYDNILADVGVNFTTTTWDSSTVSLTVALALTYVMFALEICGILSNLSLSNHYQNLFSIFCHISAVWTLVFYLFDSWPSTSYWVIFACCSLTPTVTDVISWWYAINVLRATVHTN